MASGDEQTQPPAAADVASPSPAPAPSPGPIPLDEPLPEPAAASPVAAPTAPVTAPAAADTAPAAAVTAAVTAPLAAPTAAPVAAPAAGARAGFVPRFAALLLDMIVLAMMDAVIVWTTSTAVLAAERFVGHPFGDAADVVGALVGVGSAALTVSYFVFLTAGTGQTIGKAALKIRVVRPDGRPIGVARSALRFAGYFASALPLGMGFLAALASSRRALHDRLAGTIVERV